MKINSFGKTDPGLKRTNNEDSYVIREDLNFCAVADGMGGAAAGEIASRIFVDTATCIYEEWMRSDKQDPALPVQKTYITANSRIIEHISRFPEHKGMGTTAELLSISDDLIIIGHVGDSRTYRLRNGVLKQITKDHSLIREQIDKGIITALEAKNHRMRHVILRAVGVEENVSLDIIRSKAVEGDIYLLCSDGLTDMADDDAIEKCMNSYSALDGMASGLIDLANAGGGKDNITVVLARISEV
jgi:serine/threonine protein phosphatase PrpC